MAATLRVVDATRTYTKGAVVFTVLGGVIVFLGSLAYRPPELQKEFPADYSFRYGEDRPFAPSLAKTSTGGAFDARSLGGSESCGQSGCHTEIVEEWKVSAHRLSARL